MEANSKPLQPFLAAAIVQLREEKGWNKEELALIVGVSQSEISHNESGRRDPRWSTLERLAGVLGVSGCELVELAEKLREAEQQEDRDT